MLDVGWQILLYPGLLAIKILSPECQQVDVPIKLLTYKQRMEDGCVTSARFRI
jgi:hypothetical protein